MDTSGCRHERLASGPCCAVDRCGHGAVHLHIGVLSLRLTPAQLVAIAETLGDAARSLELAAAPPRDRLC